MESLTLWEIFIIIIFLHLSGALIQAWNLKVYFEPFFLAVKSTQKTKEE